MSLLQLADVKPHLKIDQSTDDVVLQGKLDSAEAYVAEVISAGSALSAQTITERVDGCRGILILRCLPIISVTSVTGADGILIVDSLDLDKPAGLVRYTDSTSFSQSWYTVVYQAGYATAAGLPQDVVEAVRLMTQHFYATQRGGRRSTGGDPGSQADAYSRAMQILDSRRSPGIA